MSQHSNLPSHWRPDSQSSSQVGLGNKVPANKDLSSEFHYSLCKQRKTISLLGWSHSMCLRPINDTDFNTFLRHPHQDRDVWWSLVHSAIRFCLHTIGEATGTLQHPSWKPWSLGQPPQLKKPTMAAIIGVECKIKVLKRQGLGHQIHFKLCCNIKEIATTPFLILTLNRPRIYCVNRHSSRKLALRPRLTDFRREEHKMWQSWNEWISTCVYMEVCFS